MNILHLQLSGGPGGIVCLCRDINRVSKHRNFFYFLFEGGSIADEIAAQGGVVYVETDGKKQLLHAAKKFVQYCRAHKIDVVLDHTGSVFTRFVHCYAAARLKQVRFLLYLHSNAANGTAGHSIKAVAERQILMQAYRRSDAVVAISNTVKDSFVRLYGMQADKIKVVYNGIDLDKFYRKVQRDGQFHLLFVGRIFANKGIHLLIQAIAQLEDKSRLHVDLVGSDHGGYTEKMMALTQKKHLESVITFHGARTDVADFLSKADLFVHPAICEEGFGITLIEAMAAGVPCLAFRKGAIPEIITNGENGFILDSCTADALAAGIERCRQLWQSGELEKMGENARKNARRFTIENTVAALEANYKAKSEKL